MPSNFQSEPVLTPGIDDAKWLCVIYVSEIVNCKGGVRPELFFAPTT